MNSLINRIQKSDSINKSAHFVPHPVNILTIYAYVFHLSTFTAMPPYRNLPDGPEIFLQLLYFKLARFKTELNKNK